MTGEDADGGDLGIGLGERRVIVEQEHVHPAQPLQGVCVADHDAMLEAL